MHIPWFYLTGLFSSLEEASIVGENETYPRALLHWNRAASQGMSVPHNSNLVFFMLRSTFSVGLQLQCELQVELWVGGAQGKEP